MLSRPSQTAAVRPGRLSRPRLLRRLKDALGPRSGRSITWRFPACSPRWSQPGHRAVPSMPEWCSRSRSGGPRLGADLNTTLHATFDESAIFRIDHYLGKEPCRICSISGLPTRSSNRCGTASYVEACRSPWPRASASKGGASFYEEAGASAT